MPAPPVSPLVVRPGRPLAGDFVPPGDKSVTHRAFLLALISEGESAVHGANPGADCEATLACAAALGAGIERGAGVVRIRGIGGGLVEPDHVLECGNSGTTLRLLAGVIAPRPIVAVLSGDASLNARPVDRVIAPLRRMGATLLGRDSDRRPPLVVRGGPLVGTAFEEPTASAQVASLILLAGLGARGTTAVRTRAGVRDHTPRMLPAFGIAVTRREDEAGPRFAVEGPMLPRAAMVRVPGDPSAAAFFLAAAAATPGARVTASGVSLNPTRTGFLDVLAAMGAMVERRETGRSGDEPVGEITVAGAEVLRAADVAPACVPAMVDELPAWAVAAACARGVSRLAGAAELRLKESDRLAALASQLARLGVAVEESDDGLVITGGAIGGGTVDAGGDHRIAMALAAIATRATGPVTIAGAAGIPTSYPAFAETLARLGGHVEQPEPVRA